MTVATPDADAIPASARVRHLSYFFPAHNEEANLEGLVLEALETLPRIADAFEIIAVNDGSKDRTREIADRLAAEHPGVVRAIHHERNRGYGGALRSGFEASRFDLLCFTDGDRQFRVADLARLTARMAEPDRPDVVAGYRIKRADPFIRIAYARTYKLANRIFFGLRVRDVDCACKLFTPGLAGRCPGRIGWRVLLGRAADQDPQPRPLDRRGRHPALPADRRLPDRRQAVRHRARREGLLGAATPAVGEPRARPATGPADPGGLRAQGDRDPGSRLTGPGHRSGSRATA